MLKKLLVGAAALALPAAANAAEFVENGSFETPTVPGTCCVTAPPSSILGWTAIPNVNVVIGTYASTAGNLAFAGSQYVDLLGEGSTGGLTQLVTGLTIGRVYELTFAYSNNHASTSTATAAYSIGSLAGQVTHSGATSNNLNWTVFNDKFLATNESELLSFAHISGESNGGITIDGVSLSGVPEPSTWAMMILGLGLAGAAMRRRKSAIRRSGLALA